MAKKQAKNIKDKAVDAALELAETQGWAGTSLVDIADACGCSLADLFEHFEDKTDILVALGKRIDRRVLEAVDKVDPELSARDRLFDILMERYEILNDYRGGIVAILHSFRLDPKEAVISLPHLGRSMSWMLEAAGIEISGLSGAIKVAGLTGVYLKVLKTWKDDDSQDLSKTMAALDKDLGRAERLAGMFGF